MNGPEFFDVFELVGSNYSQSQLFQFEAKTNNPWYTDYVYPLVYEGYPVAGVINLKRRTSEPLGLPPLKAIHMRQNPSDLMLKEEMVFANAPISVDPTMTSIVFNLPLEMYRDYLDFQSTAANLSVTQSSPRIDLLLLKPFPILRTGTYNLDIKYVLPGIRKVVSVNPFTINYQSSNR